MKFDLMKIISYTIFDESENYIEFIIEIFISIILIPIGLNCCKHQNKLYNPGTAMR